ncbi:peptidase domain-containing ABC transporter [Catenovulum agarivorans]|uniref:peptidase domain-containing ABC transporter n=1 Tax=Catenovulum agarivorans TaxID=1172192 RepID=UPI0002FA5140|nr:peptidase domain-containing ABC transporter [Catenovulum agarivorans]
MSLVSTPLDNLFTHFSPNKLPVIIQTEASECGLACLAMIASYYGYETDLISLRRKFSISSRGATLKQLMSISSEIELSSRALRLEVEQAPQLQMPCILHWDLNHFVVLKKINGNKYTIHDPAHGERVLSANEFSKSFTGVALELTPTPEFEQKEEKSRLTLSHFWSRIFGLKRTLIYIFVLSLLLQLFSLITPYYMQTVVDDVLLRSDQDLLVALAFGFGLLLIINTLTSLFRELVILNLSSRLNVQMALNVFRHLIRLPMEYFSKRHMGDIVSRFSSLGQIRTLLTTGLIAALLDGLMAIVTLVMMFIYSSQLSFIVLFTVIVYAVLRAILYRPIRILTEESITTAAKDSSHFMESVRAIQTIKLFQKENDRQSQWLNKLANSINKGIRLKKWNIGFASANQILFGVENILVIYFAAILVMDNLMTVGMLFAFMSYKGRFVGSMQSLIEKFIEFRMIGLHFERLADIVYQQQDCMIPKVHNSINTLQQQSSHLGHICVKSIYYKYDEIEPYVFESISFEIAAGECVAIVGPSGCGKSTLLKCLMGLIPISRGEIIVDGQPLNKATEYRTQIAAVMQDDQLLSGSIMENIACFEEQIDMDRVVICAQIACIHNDILSLPMQYNTLIGDMGSNLSGGQKQRVILARALYRNPKILFLDEATSHLDKGNEAQVNENIKQLGITRVMVAHRPETIAMADRIIELK